MTNSEELKKVIYIDGQREIELGRQGENSVLQVVFARAVEIEGGTWTLLHRRSADKEAYPVPLTTSEDGGAWEVTGSDTAYSGSGEAQLICTTEVGEILKSYIFRTSVEKALQAGETTPDPTNPWYLEILGRLDQQEFSATVVDETLIVYGGNAAVHGETLVLQGG